ncbi:HotDog domain-containing protein [Rhexocercosporidium sp. MPI-PUGE-AT-0058]|nr:HotDog domain-containing protein [Rhexocercosporidium sp. MPI-PUGE-AT-0058]
MITQLPVRACAESAMRATTSRAIQRCLRSSKTISSGRPSLLQHHIRQYSTRPPTIPPPSDLRSQFASSEPSQPVSPSIQPTPKRSLRPYIYATIFLFIGLTAGQYTRLILAPPPLPPAGTKDDDLMVEYLISQASKLPIVQSLSIDPSWTSHDAYTSLPVSERSGRLTTGPLAGARALGGYQRVFQNAETGETITVIWFGGAIAGWPGVTHGGVIATVMDESLGRCAIRQFPGRSGVTANLELNYLKPVVTNSFYVIRAVPEQGVTERKCWVQGRLETMEGRVCVESRALFVVPKKYATRALKEF